MKKCCRCKEEKPLEGFDWNNRAKGRRNKQCRECRRVSRRSWYLKNKEKHLKNVRRRSDAYRKKLQEFIIQYLQEHPCVDCGEDDVVVLEFDHVRGDKLGNVGSMRAGHSLRKIKAEIEKCEVRCCNCHRRRTSRQQNSYRLAL